MQLNEAMDIISGKKNRKGYCVSFEVRSPGILSSDHFPDVLAGEPGIESEEEAWRLAKRFAEAKQRVVNVYVIYAKDFTPVVGYRSRMLNKYLGLA